uniref:Glycosyltransferase family 25 n=1 Tax=Megaviridae environmental sample TaxID=1737588 RepID=A0A5J6VIG4_9VIRU|nr:MAG: glycosyltransferase family 25 [Megaviridae environmental sample]
MEHPPIYYINLERHTERNASMITQLNTYMRTFYRINAVDGTKLNEYNANIANLRNSTLTDNEIACLLSHVKAMMTSIDAKDDIAIIMEDDADFYLVDKWEKQLPQVLQDAPDNWQIIQLHMSNPRYLWEFAKNSSKQTYYPWQNKFTSTLCYAITRQAMIEFIEIFQGILHRQTLPHELYADKFIYTSLRTYTYYKPLFMVKLYPSSIRSSKDDTMYMIKGNRVITRYLYMCEINFIHIPKNAGTSIQDLCISKIIYHPHKTNCRGMPRQLIIIRDPVSRFISAVNYALKKHSNATYVKPLIENKINTPDKWVNALRNKNSPHNRLVLREMKNRNHMIGKFKPKLKYTYSPQYFYYHNPKYVVIYENLHVEMNYIIEKLGILGELPQKNKSEQGTLSRVNTTFIRNMYKRDVELWEKYKRIPMKERLQF